MGFCAAWRGGSGAIERLMSSRGAGLRVAHVSSYFVFGGLRPGAVGGQGSLSMDSFPGCCTLRVMSFALALLIYVGVYMASERWLGDIFTAYTRICITLLLSPAVLFCSGALIELLTGKGNGLSVLMAIAVFGLPLFLLALVGLFLGSVVGWARLGTGASVGRSPSEELASEATCSRCGHPLATHRLSAIKPVYLQCDHAGCGCPTHRDEQLGNSV